MTSNTFVPFHINATAKDIEGNNGLGRYLLLPGSDGRAQQIAQRFDNLVIKNHPRGHHLYLGTLTHNGKIIDVATVSTGMGCPSMEIILHELFSLGAKRFLRVGTSGTLQPEQVKVGNLINVQGSVRDEKTTTDYAPIGLPALASLRFLKCILSAAESLELANEIHTGIVHCKSSLYTREFGIGPMGAENKVYSQQIIDCGVLATEMETATLFIQTQIYNHQLSQQGVGPKFTVLSGAILAGIADPSKPLGASADYSETTNKAIALALETIKIMSMRD